MSAIDTQNSKEIRDSMQVSVIVGSDNAPIFSFDNSNIISCELNLRSDLSLIDPTLPESEIVVTAYWPEDVSASAAMIANDTPIKYRAGYTGDISTARVFYLSEQIQWADNVITVHGIDAIHFLDDVFDPFFIGNHFSSYNNSGTINKPYNPQEFGNVSNVFPMLYAAFCDVIDGGGVSFTRGDSQVYNETDVDGEDCVGVCTRGNRRDFIANMMNLCHQNISGHGFGATSFWLTYVDAGWPTVTQIKPSAKWTIYETDCGDLKSNYEKPIKQIDASTKQVSISPWSCVNQTLDQTKKYTYNQKVGSAEIFKNSGAGLSFDTLASNIYYVAHRDAPPSGYSSSSAHKYFEETLVIFNLQSLDYYQGKYYNNVRYGKRLFDTETNPWQDWNTASSSYQTDKLSDFWNSLVTYQYTESTASSCTVDLCGGAYNLIDKKRTYINYSIDDGVIVKPQKTTWNGFIQAMGSSIYNVLPTGGFSSILSRSNETGSFTWKGDPRMQPRDVFTYVYKDGTTESRTIESINLKHEGGGTIATITYRKGIV